jgi:hypothetical protein
MIKNNQKFVLAIPWGGFADNLKVMSKCYKYALKHNRILIVDGTNGQFRENYSNHFNLKNNVNNLIINYSEDIEKYLNTLSIYPKELSGRIGLFKARGGWIESNFKYIDPEKNTVLNFDFDINYSEDCLIHNWHGEQEDFSILETLTFSESLKSRLNQIRSEKFEPYDAIHIRCTDKYVDFRSFFSEIRNNLENESLLVCSDNKEVIGYAKEFFIEKKIWTATTSHAAAVCSTMVVYGVASTRERAQGEPDVET